MKSARAGVLLSLVFLIGDTPAPQGARPAPDLLAERGNVLFADAFTAGPSHEWLFDRDSVWTVEDGHLKATLPNERQQRSFAFVGSEEWRDYAFDFDVSGVRGVDKGVAVRVDGERRGVGLDLRGARYNDLVMYRGYEHWARGPVVNENGKWQHVHIEVRRNRYKAYVNGDLTIDFTDEINSRPRGRVALAAYTGGIGECEVLYDNVEVRALK